MKQKSYFEKKIRWIFEPLIYLKIFKEPVTLGSIVTCTMVLLKGQGDVEKFFGLFCRCRKDQQKKVMEGNKAEKGRFCRVSLCLRFNLQAWTWDKIQKITDALNKG